ncbi:hypothetical protein [Dickeya zeae]|uniref:hypothetical protein n=1 Tax=Dickeya zeae TaxID=204042 RepID=UPI0014436E4B|nr:hypothetical protein [Dickeya zeae]
MAGVTSEPDTALRPVSFLRTSKRNMLAEWLPACRFIRLSYTDNYFLLSLQQEPSVEVDEEKPSGLFQHQ